MSDNPDLGRVERLRIGQCPGCWSYHKVPLGVTWECDCGERVTVVDLRDSEVAVQLAQAQEQHLEKARIIGSLAAQLDSATKYTTQLEEQLAEREREKARLWNELRAEKKRNEALANDAFNRSTVPDAADSGEAG